MVQARKRFLAHYKSSNGLAVWPLIYPEMQDTNYQSWHLKMCEGIVKHNPQKSIRRAAAEAGLSNTTTYRIMRKDLKILLYKIQRQEMITNSALLKRKFLQVRFDESTIDVGCLSTSFHFNLEGETKLANIEHWKPAWVSCKTISIWKRCSLGWIVK